MAAGYPHLKGRILIVVGGLTAFAVIGLWFAIVPDFFTPSADAEAFDRIEYGLNWAVVLQLPLLLGILIVAQQRFFFGTHADGSAPDAGSSLEINRRCLTNTVEQTVLATVGLLALSISVPVEYLSYIPTLTLLFLFGRFCFWAGYHIYPYARSFGLVLTFVPSIAVYVYLLGNFFGSAGN